MYCGKLGSHRHEWEGAQLDHLQRSDVRLPRTAAQQQYHGELLSCLAHPTSFALVSQNIAPFTLLTKTSRLFPKDVGFRKRTI